MKNINNFLTANIKEWNAIQQFYSIPNFNKCDDFGEQKNRNVWETILTKLRQSEPDISEEDLELRLLCVRDP